MKREHFFNFSASQRSALIEALSRAARDGFCPGSAAEVIPRIRAGARDFFAGEITFLINTLSQYGDAELAEQLANDPAIRAAIKANYQAAYMSDQGDQEPPPGGAR